MTKDFWLFIIVFIEFLFPLGVVHALDGACIEGTLCIVPSSSVGGLLMRGGDTYFGYGGLIAFPINEESDWGLLITKGVLRKKDSMGEDEFIVGFAQYFWAVDHHYSISAGPGALKFEHSEEISPAVSFGLNYVSDEIISRTRLIGSIRVGGFLRDHSVGGIGDISMGLLWVF